MHVSKLPIKISSDHHNSQYRPPTHASPSCQIHVYQLRGEGASIERQRLLPIASGVWYMGVRAPSRLIFYYNPKDAAYMARKRSRDTGRDNSRQNEPWLSHYQSHQRKPVRRSVHATTGRESWNNCPSIGRHLHRLLATALRCQLACHVATHR